MIALHGVPTSDRGKVLEAIRTGHESGVYVETCAGGEQFSGTLDQLPHGGPYFATNGKLKMMFHQRGRFLSAE